MSRPWERSGSGWVGLSIQLKRSLLTAYDSVDRTRCPWVRHALCGPVGTGRALPSLRLLGRVTRGGRTRLVPSRDCTCGLHKAGKDFSL